MKGLFLELFIEHEKDLLEVLNDISAQDPAGLIIKFANSEMNQVDWHKVVPEIPVFTLEEVIDINLKLEKTQVANDSSSTDNNGVVVKSYADCKNAELNNAKWLYYPCDTLSDIENIKSFLPQNPEYGWMLNSVNTPLVAGGNLSFKLVEDLIKQTGCIAVSVDWNVWQSKFTEKQKVIIKNAFQSN